jgi:prepilin-type N-terminal cleavage/methylation domain-containing protein
MMSPSNRNRTPRQRGFSLAEILVAMAVFTVVIMAALLVYDRSNKVFKTSVEASDMQQSTRVAFDRLVSDLRMTGFDYDRDGTPFGSLAADWTKETPFTTGMRVQPTSPNGHTYVCITGGKSGLTQPLWPEDSKATIKDGDVVWQEDGTLQYQQADEQVEYAGKAAIAIRANFNYDTATGPCKNATDPCENGREPKLQSTPFPVVTTANNEIVVYALKPVKWASGESGEDLIFYADTAIPRNANPLTDGKEKKITISGVELCDNGCNSPPYTLYRYTLDDNGDPDAGTPVADNIRSMNFRYFDTTSAAEADVLATYPKGDGQYDGSKPNEPLTAREDRATIRAIEITLTGMNSQPDSKYTDTTDTVAPHYRKLALKSLVVPRNMAKRGMKEYNTTEPGAPILKSVCAGSCNSVYLTWSAPTTGGDIDSYAVLYDRAQCADLATGGFQYSEEVGLNLEGNVGRYVEPGEEWSFAVQAINKWGAKNSNCIRVKVINTTKPAALKDLKATHPANASPYQGVPNQVVLYFPPAEANVSGTADLTCSGGGGVTQGTMPPSEKRYYEIYRAVDKVNFQPGDAGVVRVLDAGSAVQPVSNGDGLMKWVDTTAANCTTYHYRIRVVDYCARNAAWNNPAGTAQGTSDYYPELAANAIAGYADASAKPKAPSLTLKSKSCAGASNNCDLTLGWGAVTQNTSDETITVRQYVVRGYLWNGTAYNTAADWSQTVTDALEVVKHVNATEQWKFVVHALDCNESAPSNALIFPCTFAGGNVTASLISGSYSGGGTLASPYVVEGATLKVTTDSSVSEIAVDLYYVDTGAQIGATVKQTNTSSATFTLPNTDDGEEVHVLVTAKDSGGCVKNAEMWIIDQAAPACSLTDTGTKSSLISTPANKTVQFKLENVSTSALTLVDITVKFSTSGNQELSSVSFNGGTAVTVNCDTGTAKVAPATTQTIGASNAATPYPILMTFDKNTSLTTVSSVCVTYRAATGDLLSCQMHPNATTCTAAAGACQ